MSSRRIFKPTTRSDLADREIAGRLIHVNDEHLFMLNSDTISMHPLIGGSCARGMWPIERAPIAILSHIDDVLVCRTINSLFQTRHVGISASVMIPITHTAVFHKWRNSYLVHALRRDLFECNQNLEVTENIRYECPPTRMSIIPSQYSAQTYFAGICDSKIFISVIDRMNIARRLVTTPWVSQSSVYAEYRPNSADAISIATPGCVRLIDPWHTSRSGIPCMLTSRGLELDNFKHVDHNVCVLRTREKLVIADLRHGTACGIYCAPTELFGMWCAVHKGTPMIFIQELNGGRVYM